MDKTPREKILDKNLMVGEWTSPSGERHVSLTRIGKYNKNIAIPISVLDDVIAVLQDKRAEMISK